MDLRKIALGVGDFSFACPPRFNFYTHYLHFFYNGKPPQKSLLNTPKREDRSPSPSPSRSFSSLLPPVPSVNCLPLFHHYSALHPTNLDAVLLRTVASQLIFPSSYTS